jgi:hypothetical protein
MPDAATKQTEIVRWGIYHRDREWARETGDACLAVMNAAHKEGAENQPRLDGICGPTGLWAHQLPNTEELRLTFFGRSLNTTPPMLLC